MSAPNDCLVTVIVAPRERFSVARASLDSILADRTTPFELVYVDGASPRPLRRYLRDAAGRHGFTLLTRDHFLAPNHARNLGLSLVQTKYVIFIDNDVVVSRGWVAPLISCAEESGAAIVSPLICQGQPMHSIIHCGGGVCELRETARDGRMRRRLIEQIRLQGISVEEARPKLKRGPTALAEFHCMMVRTDFLRALGGLDNELLNTREHLDLCLLAKARGESIWLEPGSVVTYLHDAPLKLSDVHYYMLRWCDDWERRSLVRIRDKWQLSEGGSINYRLANVGLRRRYHVVHPVAKLVTLGLGTQPRRRAVALLSPIERRINHAVSRLHRWRAASSG
jgi:GT2 family glycosyltransferase